MHCRLAVAPVCCNSVYPFVLSQNHREVTINSDYEFLLVLSQLAQTGA